MKKNSNMIFGMIVTVLALGLISLLVILSDTKSEPTATTTKKLVDVEGQPVLGEADAPVTIVEFGDFKCPACKVWGEEVFPQLVKDYVDTGKVKFSYVNVLIHGEESQMAGLAAESVLKNSPEQYWEFHKALFESQPDEETEWITLEKIKEITDSIPGIVATKVEREINEEKGNDELERDANLVEKHNINRTPTIVINGIKINDPLNYDVIAKIIEKELEEEKSS
ncbi:DsbA family protein [Rossellomorea marisflavi]|uniref:DsbA family protein n=1 Tax=Rossellomorea marisflavi TaxID=189381 RepID=UPI00345937CB